MDGRKRIAIYGGTFDPVHRGHVEVAKKTVELFEITRLLFVPARQAPHKLEREITPPLHRYAMLVLATQDDPRLLISTFELDAPDRRYTIDTLKHFRSEVEKPVDLFFIMGADSWAEITTWREWNSLMQTANHIVVTRPGHEVKLTQDGLTSDTVAAEILDVRGWDQQHVTQVLDQTEVPRVYISDAAMFDVSATAVREAARAKHEKDLNDLVPACVADYITKYGLYKNSNET